eukprot:5188256-Ditylum_brightwellii.AAC.1
MPFPHSAPCKIVESFKKKTKNSVFHQTEANQHAKPLAGQGEGGKHMEEIQGARDKKDICVEIRCQKRSEAKSEEDLQQEQTQNH